MDVGQYAECFSFHCPSVHACICSTSLTTSVIYVRDDYERCAILTDLNDIRGVLAFSDGTKYDSTRHAPHHVTATRRVEHLEASTRRGIRGEARCTLQPHSLRPLISLYAPDSALNISMTHLAKLMGELNPAQLQGTVIRPALNATASDHVSH